MKRKKVAEPRRQIYGGGRIPASYLPAHNHVAHGPRTPHGANGFRRFWIPPEWVLVGEYDFDTGKVLKGTKWVECPCGWQGSPKWMAHGKHYALPGHVEATKKKLARGETLRAWQPSDGDM